MQRKLATWSTADDTRKFERLLRLITHPAWLAETACVTLASSGAKSSGIDSMDKSKLGVVLAQELARLRGELLVSDYQLVPARRVLIPKANGKPQPLGIPTLRDRLVQRAVLMGMEPIWASDFYRDSYSVGCPHDGLVSSPFSQWHDPSLGMCRSFANSSGWNCSKKLG